MATPVLQYCRVLFDPGALPVEKDPVFGWQAETDRLTDGEEVFDYYTDPLRWDSDGDGLSDGEEIRLGTRP